MQKDLLIAASDTIEQMKDAIARYYCGERKELSRCSDDPPIWRVRHPDPTGSIPDTLIHGVEVRLNGGRYRFIAPATPYREELTAAGPQLVIPGCERKPRDTGKPARLDLFA